ncbi:MAG: nucleotidyltransferase domain-containing protein [Candidatus Jordarchaeales archaeon]|nr:nucleotidyltransferase domain-containing protein [Candidatus Jordarchaeia archaeon]
MGKRYSLPGKERDAVIERIRKTLEERGVVFAVVFGGALDKAAFHGIDVGVYAGFEADSVSFALYAEELSAKLTRVAGIPVDVVILNHAPMWLRYRALKGVVIVDRDPVLRVSLKLAAIDNILLKARRWEETRQLD